MKLNVALVLQGGGTRGIYTSGALDFLLEKGAEFPLIIGVSCGALNGVNFVAGNKGRTKEIMFKYMKDLRFVSVPNFLLHGSLFNFKFMWEEMPKKLPFNQKQYDESETRFLVGTTSLETGKAVFFEKGVCQDFKNAVAASSSLPRITTKPVMVEGHPCLDGGPSCSIGFHKALEEGYVPLIICTREKGYRKAEQKPSTIKACARLYKKYPAFVDTIRDWSKTYNKDMEEIDSLGESGKAFVLYPSIPVHIGIAERKKEKLEALYQQGYKDMEARFDELLEFLKRAE